MTRWSKLDGLRGVLAVMVVLSHIAAMTQDVGVQQPGVLGRLWHLGAPAVDAFFVLSGLVVTHALLCRPRGYWTYLAGRARRLLPLAYFGVVWGMLLVWPLTGHLRAGAGNVLDELSAPVNAGTLLSALSATALHPGAQQFNPPLWSLRVELQVALIMPLVVSSAALIGWAMVPLSLILGLVLSLAGWSSGFYLMNFMLGALLALRPPTLTKRAALAALLVGCALLMVREITLSDNSFQRFVSGLGAGLIISGLLGRHTWGNWLERPAFQVLGQHSYALYVTHFPVMLWGAHLLSGSGLWWPGALLSLPVVAVCTALVHRAVERPFQRRTAPAPAPLPEGAS